MLASLCRSRLIGKLVRLCTISYRHCKDVDPGAGHEVGGLAFSICGVDALGWHQFRSAASVLLFVLFVDSVRWRCLQDLDDGGGQSETRPAVGEVELLGGRGQRRRDAFARTAPVNRPMSLAKPFILERMSSFRLSTIRARGRRRGLDAVTGQATAFCGSDVRGRDRGVPPWLRQRPSETPWRRDRSIQRSSFAAVSCIRGV